MTIDERKARLLGKTGYDYDDLREIIDILRHEGGCPWDIEQNHHSIRKGMIEECYEVVEAIDNEDPVLLREELGDVLLQILFHADIEKDAGRFDMNDVANDECLKMIRRHPHVFGSVIVGSSEQVLQNWETIKAKEKKRTTLSEKLASVPPMLPALMRAQKIEKKAADAGLSSPSPLNIALEALQKMPGTSEDEKRSLLGKALQALTAYAFAEGIEAEEVLSNATNERITFLSQTEEKQREADGNA